MKKQKRVLNLKKFKVASLNIGTLKGGTDPDEATPTHEKNTDQPSCISQYDGNPCTEGQARTNVNNTCTDTHDGNDGISG